MVADEDEKPDHKEKIRKFFNPVLYIKWSIIVFNFQSIYSSIKGYRKKLILLQQNAIAPETKDDDNAQKKMEMPSGLESVLAYRKEDEAMLFPDDAWVLKMFIHLSRAADIIGVEKDSSRLEHSQYRPGDRVTIPKGEFLYGDNKDKKNIDYDFEIDAFPVTHYMYRPFIEDNPDVDVPHVNKQWAKPYNWDKNTRTYPEGKGNHPVVLVDFGDAERYCKWRSLKEGVTYRLPTEKEWEKAARGEDGRAYPWGNKFDPKRCNTRDAGINETTDVTQYPEGRSPYGVYDMAGNVWEWTQSDYDTELKVLRGGSWCDDRGLARCASRDWNDPVIRVLDVGYRCVRTLV